MIYRLKGMRITEGFTQIEFAKALGVTQTAVSAWETGRVVPSTKNIKKIAEVLNKPIDEIFSLFNIDKVIN
ncbi:helix-turn-helix transcriptional regulator [Ligilactobacillus sp. LYQ139]|uniref:helix-turn-helix transcriptional regulator n=1 Tax=Ligilactobacillus sp. LYQ139 TaxID=3378800 RepID=UPI0038533FCA